MSYENYNTRTFFKSFEISMQEVETSNAEQK